ncbi:energy-coupling factor transporter ATP-binding protein EcfA2 [Catenulispora sp. MAP12-49]|uniref:ATP-dependent nuclease n=1 Tax=Catenulispora sp. MAP12-49 TaxID=3156302 RepID=UPI0035134F80
MNVASGMDRRVRVWERLKQDPSNGITDVTIERSPVLARQDIRFGQLTVVTGTHGVGKSYLLRSIAALLPRGYGFPMGPPFFSRSRSNEGVIDGRFTATYLNDETPHKWTVDLGEVRPDAFAEAPLSELGEQAPWTRYVEPSLMFSEYSVLFQNFESADRLPSRRLDPLRHEELEYLRDILGRRYESFDWRELNTEPSLDDDYYWVPHVKAIVDGRAVTSTQMSSGELWVHYVLWSLRTAGPEQIILIDEPEAFLSPAGHRPFLDEIARLTLANKAQTIVATHSAAMIARTPASMIRVLAPGLEGAQIVSPSSPASALRMLGHAPGLAGIVLVEDDLARRIIQAFLARIDSHLAHRVDVIDSGGKDQALATARIMQRSSRLGVCVVLDGDQRTANIDHNGITLAYLPGNEPDEAILAAVRANPDRLAERAALNSDDVTVALDALRFHPHQYWFAKLAGSLGIKEEEVVNHLIFLWLQDDAVHEEATQIIRKIAEALVN